MTRTIKFETSDGMTFDVDVPVARCFNAITTIVGDRDLDDVPEDEVIPLKDVKAVHFEKILQWTQIHQDNPNLLQDSEETDLQEWEHDLFQASAQTLNELQKVASYLKIPRLESSLRREVKKSLGAFPKARNVEDFKPKTEVDAPLQDFAGLSDMVSAMTIGLLKEVGQTRNKSDESNLLDSAVGGPILLKQEEQKRETNEETNLFDLAMGGRNLPAYGEPNLLDFTIGGGNWSIGEPLHEPNILDLAIGGPLLPKEGEQMRETNDETNLLDLAMGGRHSPEYGEPLREPNLLDFAMGGRDWPIGDPLREPNLLDLAMGGGSGPIGEQMPERSLLDWTIGGRNSPDQGEQKRDQNLLDLAMGGGHFPIGEQKPERSLLDLAMDGGKGPEKGEHKREENDESNLLDMAMGGRDSPEDTEQKREENE